ncbi:hypothetical protein GE09DRAFT_1217472 [Coniochaeta sp. 2T2.1]|nr:hypothetical protein GE09DRAFT_1217472 [Coniochaeta sp. 2T2.1]
MSGLKDIVKKGWHPEKDVPIKDSLKGLVGKGNKKEETYRNPTPISSLRDPASFPPPPKHVATGATPSPPPGQPYRPPATGPAHQSYTNTRVPQEPAVEEPPPPPRPYRVDTTGLSTSHLPPPPRRAGDATTSTPSPPPSYTHAKPAPPSLPPRLPPRTASPAVSASHPPPPPVRSPQPATATTTTGPQAGYLNQSAINSLSARGISVPGFGIGSPPPPTSPSATTPSQPTGTTGTTWAQKRAALQTASSLHKDPSSVSVADASSAASTLHNFHQRHGDQVTSVAARANALAGHQPGAPSHPTPSATPVSLAAAKKKPPPPPPPAKKPALSSCPSSSQANDTAPPPPPVPLATRPKF